MVPPAGVSDEVWAQLDPGAGRPPRRIRRVTVGVASLVAVVLGCWCVASMIGVVNPRLTSQGWEAEFSPGHRTVSQTVTVTNASLVGATLTGVASPVAALRVTGVDGLPATVPGGDHVTITVHYRVTDCSPFVDRPAFFRTDGPWPPPLDVQVTRWWGTVTVPVSSTPDSAAGSACQRTQGP